VEQLFVALPLARDPLLLLATRDASVAIRVERKAEIFVPVSLLLGEEEEGPATATAGSFAVEIVGDRERGEILLRNIGLDGRVRNATIRARVPVQLDDRLARFVVVFRRGFRPVSRGPWPYRGCSTKESYSPFWPVDRRATLLQ
jgi:hypothetical protein